MLESLHNNIDLDVINKLLKFPENQYIFWKIVMRCQKTLVFTEIFTMSTTTRTDSTKR